MQNIRFWIERSASGTYQPESRRTMRNGQKAVTARKNIHHERSASPPATYSIDREIVCPRNGPKRWLNRNIRTPCRMPRDCLRLGGMNQSTDAFSRDTKVWSLFPIALDRCCWRELSRRDDDFLCVDRKPKSEVRSAMGSTVNRYFA